MDFGELIKQLIDFKVKLNLAMVLGIIGILAGIKLADKKRHIPTAFYLPLCIIAGFIAGIAAIPGDITVRQIMSYGIAHAGFASILYQSRKIFLPGKDNIFNKKKGE